MKGKYIRYESDNGEDTVIIFPQWVVHADVAHRLRVTPISAGFIAIDFVDGKVVCYGHSESLRLESVPDVDSKAAGYSLGFY